MDVPEKSRMRETKLERMNCWKRGGVFRLAASMLVACGVLGGCVVGPKYHAPAASAPAAYKETPAPGSDTGDWKVATPQDAMLRGKWWEVFNDAELNSLEDQLNVNNQTIKASFENYMAARALVREARSQYYPTITVGPAISRSRTSGTIGNAAAASGGSGTGTTSSGGVTSGFFELPGEVSWEPDLWGKVRNTVRQYQAAAQVSAADLENVRLTEQASLAQYVFELRGQDALQKLYDDTVASDKKTLELTQSLYDTGIDQEISVVEAQNTLQNAEAQAINIGLLRAQYEHAIAMLVGKSPADVTLAPKPLDATPPPIPMGVPSQLLERRPDIAAAERTMAEANAQIGIAYAAYYPTLTLAASGGFETSTFTKWLSWPSRFWSIGPSLSETVFDGGLRRATVNQYVATYNADLANYRQTVLVAFQQVEDYMAAERILSREVEKQKEAVASAQQFFDLELNRYQTGIDPYIDVLTAQNTLLSDQQGLAALHTQQMTAAVQLVEALGGGWDKSQLPAPSEVTQKPPADQTTKEQ
jgi:NodT family efflux transporter outer membrane factor (OMF) lipoprotein